MAIRGKSRAVDPEEAFKALKELSRALRHAVTHPTFDARGRLVYQVRPVGRGRARAPRKDPVSVPVKELRCRPLYDGRWDTKAMGENHALILRLAGYLYHGA
jgi:hypothetical protein